MRKSIRRTDFEIRSDIELLNYNLNYLCKTGRERNKFESSLKNECYFNIHLKQRMN